MSGIGTPVVATAVPTNTNTETAILTIPFSGGNATNPSLANPPAGNPCKNRISGSINITAGTGTTAVVIRCRKGAGTVTGTQVGLSRTVQLAAGNTAEIPLFFEDQTGGYAQAYTVTVQQTAGTAAGTVNYIESAAQDYN